MKLSARDVAAYLAKPDPNKAGMLIFGEDTARVALKRHDVMAALVGPDAEREMRLARMTGAELRKDPAQLLDALKAQGFFPGPRAVLVEEAADGTTKAVAAALEDWRPGDAFLVVTAGALMARSSLRKLFEGSNLVYAAGLYNDPPTRAEIEAQLSAAGLSGAMSGDGGAALEALARELPPGDFRQTLEKIALYKFDDPTPLTPQEVLLAAPATTDAVVDDLLHVVAEGRTPEIGPFILRLKAQGVAAVTLLIMATRHFRSLHGAASDPAGASQGMARLRPPVFGPRRDRMIRQAQGWGRDKLETALEMLLDTDLSLRTAGRTAPEMALVERLFIRLAMLSKR